MKFLLGFFSLEWLRVFDFLAPLAIRLLLAPVFWVDGVKRLGLFSSADFVWFNPLTWWNQDAFVANAAALSNSVLSGMGAETLSLLVGGIEIAGAILLIFGFAVRWMVLALMFVVVVLGLTAVGANGMVGEAQKLVMEHGFVTMEHSQMEVYLTYLVLLLALFFMGAGRWFSMDWYMYRSFARKIENKEAGRHDPFEVDASDEPGIRKV